jgi:hypothetical protein
MSARTGPAAPTLAQQRADDARRHRPTGASALALALAALLALLLLAGCGGGDGCDTHETGPNGQCLERRTTDPVDCNREPEKCR